MDSEYRLHHLTDMQTREQDIIYTKSFVTFGTCSAVLWLEAAKRLLCSANGALPSIYDETPHLYSFDLATSGYLTQRSVQIQRLEKLV